jgi:hypothetical protein
MLFRCRSRLTSRQASQNELFHFNLRIRLDAVLANGRVHPGKPCEIGIDVELLQIGSNTLTYDAHIL